MTDALAMELSEEFANSGEDSMTLRWSGSGGQPLDQILTFRNLVGDHLNSDERARGVKNNRLHLRGGDLHAVEAIRGEDFPPDTAGAEIEISRDPAPPSAVDAGSNDEGAGSGNRRGINRSAAGVTLGSGAAADDLAQA